MNLRLIVFLHVFTILLTLSAQEVKIFGTGVNSIFSLNPSNSEFNILQSFNPELGAYPNDLVSYNGDYIGVASSGGQSNEGVIFMMDANGTSFKVLHNFESETGATPTHIIEENGILYGTTSGGGQFDLGVIYSFDLGQGLYETLYQFQEDDGPISRGKLTLINNKLWGTLFSGGQNNAGLIFHYDLNDRSFHRVHDFESNNGIFPFGNLQLFDNKIWGITQNGGNNSAGTIFSLDLNDLSFSKEYDFDFSSGSFPVYGLVERNGYLWGLTKNGGANSSGTIFMFNPNGSIYSKVYDFDSSIGMNPSDVLIIENDFIYGATTSGGVSNNGIVYSFDLANSSFTKIKDVQYGNNVRSLFFTANKLILGVNEGGMNNFGLIYELDLINNNSQILTEFGSDVPVSGLYSGLIVSNSRLWGISTHGGEFGNGAIFSLKTDGSGFNLEHSFNQNNGALAYGNTLKKIGDNLWGATTVGGNSNNGVIFYFDTNSSEFHKVHDFNHVDGSRPYGQFLLINDELWGMTAYGGTHDYGCVYKINMSGGDFEKVFDFNGTNGRYAFGNSLSIHNERIWGTTRNGGLNGNGVLFNFSTDGNDFKIAHNFDAETGASPRGKLIEIDGKIWGLTSGGGENLGGIAYSYDLTTNSFEVAHSFNGRLDKENGYGSFGGLALLDDEIWGFATFGGVNDYGSIFTINKDDNSFSKKVDLTNEIGEPFYQSPLIYEEPVLGLINQPKNIIYPSPTKDFFSLTDFNFTKATISIYDSQGKLVMKEHVNASQSIDVRPLKSGVFLVMIEETGQFLGRLVKE